MPKKAPVTETRNSKSVVKELPKKFDIITSITCTIDGRLANLLAKSFTEGYELVCPPVFTHLGEPARLNGNAVGFKHPHFLVVLRRESKSE